MAKGKKNKNNVEKKAEKPAKEGKVKIDHSEEVKRLNRVIGQMEGIRRMLEDGKKLDNFLVQCKAVHSALKSIEARVLSSHVELVLNDLSKTDKKKARAEKIAEVSLLFKQAS